MKLHKKTRERLRAASPKPVEFKWNQDEDPKRGKVYRVYGSDPHKPLFNIRVEGVKGQKVVARIDADPYRPMVGLKGQRNELGDYEDEPERVSAEWEAELAMRASGKTAIVQAARREVSRAAADYSEKGHGTGRAVKLKKARKRLEEVL